MLVSYNTDIAILMDKTDTPGLAEVSDCQARYLIIVGKDGAPKGVIDRTTLALK